MSIQRKIAMAISLLAILLIIILGSVSSKIAKDALIGRSNEFLDSILTRNEYELELNIFAVEKVTRTLSEDLWTTYNAKRGETDSDYNSTYLDKIAPSVKLAAELSPSKSAFIMLFDTTGVMNGSIWYADKNGDLIPTLESNNALLEHLDIEAILQNPTVETEFEWFNYFEGETLATCISTVNFNNTSIAIVGVDLNGRNILNRLDASQFMNSGYLYILDDQGKILHHPHLDKGNSFKQNDLILQSDDYLILDKELSNEWYLSVSVSREDLFRGLNKIDQLIVLLMAVGGVVTILFSYYTAKHIAEPYKYLTRQIAKVGQGDYDITIDSKYFKRSDEVGILSKTVQQMIDTQRESFKKIKDNNTNLELLIEARTHELIDTNLELEASVTEVEEQKAILERTLIEIKKTREQLIEAEKIASSRHVAIGIAHKLNTPIGNTLMLSSYLEENIQSLINKIIAGTVSKNDLVLFLEESNTIISKVLLNLSTCTTLINKFKEFTTDNSNTLTALINLQIIVSEQIQLVSRGFSTLDCIFDVDIEEGLTLKSDLTTIQKLFFELLTNSFEHGFSTIEKPLIRISASRIDKNLIQIIYQDNGIGIDKENEKELFTPLFTSSLASNFGLGLSLVYRIINEIYKGSISLIKEEHGLGFSIILKDVTNDEEDQNV